MSECEHEFSIIKKTYGESSYNVPVCDFCHAECEHPEKKWEDTSADLDICSDCGDHTTFKICGDCGEELGSECCGAGPVCTDRDWDMER